MTRLETLYCDAYKLRNEIKKDLTALKELFGMRHSLTLQINETYSHACLMCYHLTNLVNIKRAQELTLELEREITASRM